MHIHSFIVATTAIKSLTHHIDIDKLILLVVIFALLNARQDGQEGPFEVLCEHVGNYRLASLLLARRASNGPRQRITRVLSHLFVLLLEDLDDQTASLEEGEEDELERLLHVDHKELQVLHLLLPFLGLGELLIHLFRIPLLLQKVRDFL